MGVMKRRLNCRFEVGTPTREIRRVYARLVYPSVNYDCVIQSQGSLNAVMQRGLEWYPFLIKFHLTKGGVLIDFPKDGDRDVSRVEWYDVG